MKFLCCISIAFLIFTASPSRPAAQSTNATKNALTNKDVVDLAKTGLSDEIIIAKINASPDQFDTSTAGLKDLKAAGISDPVILAMVKASSRTAVPTGTADPASGVVGSSAVAHVLIYRPHQGPGGGFYPTITIDDKPIVKISNGRRCSVRITLGPHTIKSDDKSSAISIDAKGGQEFFVSVQELPGAPFKGRGKLTLVAPEQGRAEYRLAKPVEEERKIDRETIEADGGSQN